MTSRNTTKDPGLSITLMDRRCCDEEGEKEGPGDMANRSKSKSFSIILGERDLDIRLNDNDDGEGS